MWPNLTTTMHSLWAFLILLCAFECINAELTPPYFNLATGRQIYASATCGEGVEGRELYCKLVGANTEHDIIDYSVIQGQVCDYCDPNSPERNHAAEYAIDGTEAWWMSPPLSRGMKYNEVNLTIDFGQEFHVAYLFIRMGNSPRPGLWTLEKSTDYGKTWKPWQHFSDTPADCETYFGKGTYKPSPTKDDDVICTTEYSKIVPLENGEIPVMLLNDRPSATNYFNSSVLQEWTRATNVRFRFLRTKNLLGHLMSVSRQDPTVTRRYFYSIKDISIGGRCMCNGHADTCDVLDPKSPKRILACRCQHETCGIQCNECCPGFLQKRWRQNTNARPFECEPCNCHGHTTECEYDEDVDHKGLSLDIHGKYSGGGVCKNCQHNTEGINCNKCTEKYYRPLGKYWNETDVCKPCDCDFFYSTGHCEEFTGRCECKKAYKPPNCDSCAYGYYGYPDCKECECNLEGTEGYHCELLNGECPCKHNFAGKYCKQCAEGFFGFPECKPCSCNQIGAVNDNCDLSTGQCICLSNFGGDRCERCKHGYFNYPKCQYCDCDNEGTEEEVCEKDSGKCICRKGFGGPRCDKCLPGYFNYPECTPCNCSITGSSATTCDSTGKCNCLPNFAGKKCTLCSAGYYNYPECLQCNCDPYGSEGVSCNTDGQCSCLNNFDGKLCDTCKEGFYNFPACEDCNCDPAGVIDKFAGCGSVPKGMLCECKERVTGRICNECKPLYWNLNISNPDGCEECNCWTDGTLSGLNTCESKSGQCACKPHTTGRTCRDCAPGTYNLDGASLFGCMPCDCDVGGTQELGCNDITGQCKCHPRITGRDCTQPLTTHYYPTLHQFQYEFEDGEQLSGAQVRYEYNEDVFPGFSSRGYAVFNDIQNEIKNDVTVFKSEVYRVIIRYVNPTPENITVNILIQSENPTEVDQNIKVSLRPTATPQFATVSGPKGIKPSAIVLDPGKYVFTTKANNNVMLDYFVLLPSAYYEASILTRKILTPCEYKNMELCRHYKYPSLEEYEPHSTPYVTGPNGQPQEPSDYYSEPEYFQIINRIGDIPVLSGSQPQLKYNIDVPHSGYYIFVLDYVSDVNYAEPFFVKLALEGKEEYSGSGQLYTCLYTTPCRTPIVDDNEREKIFYIDQANPLPIVVTNYDDNANDRIPILSVTAIPVEQYSIDFINPSPVCVIHNKQCVNRKFPTVPDSKRIEFETDNPERLSVNKPPYALLNEHIKLVQISSKHNASISIESELPERKRYVVIVKYYQPNHAKFQVPYIINSGKNNYEGKFEIKHCPASAGCLGVLHPSNTEDWWFDLEAGQLRLTLTNPVHNMLWLDYVIIVPVNLYNEDLLQEETFDQTEEFIKSCGQDHFHITHNASEFCQKAVFSLTAGYNAGALPCGCNDKGSTSFECHPFGGQCQCKPNVIGRQCDACRTGFYGFPDCQPCTCPITAMCEPQTGACMCPPNVMGELCDKCMPNTYGFHKIIGCEQCNCAPEGILPGHEQCDMFNGSCTCSQHIEGRACDKCSNGYFNYPYCDQCSCNLAGSQPEVCDKYDGNCICKSNVQGRDCEQCVPGTFNLQESNPEGCTSCFCFGKTSRCESEYLRVYNISLMQKLTVNVANFKPKSIDFEFVDIPAQELLINDTAAQLDFTQLELSSDDNNLENPLYFGTLEHLVNQNHHIYAYGGVLSYKLYFTTGASGKSLYHPDIVLVGADNVLVHYSYEQPASNQLFVKSLQMIESNFLTLEGKPVTRAEFMMLLRDLNMIYVRANYWEQTLVTQLSDILLTIGDPEAQNYDDNALGSSYLPFERCQCPPGYEGLSCQDCAPGYYRDPSGPYGGYCIKCECHGHTDTCDCKTGICTNCQHSTTGDHCEQCIEGYYGNATIGTPHDCMICACPLPYDSNNFATSCEISESGEEIHCECKPGYTGARCESCANGFFGNPEVWNNTCQPCQCSGNIDVQEQGACDTRTGECLRCLNNTYGTACNLCAPGYFGDAINLKNCQSCDCVELGTLACDTYQGKCECQQHVIGESCDRCEPDHYGYDSGFGCRACECGLASYSTQCDDHTGQCDCKPGITGRRCDYCAPDHWNYTIHGCTPCNCNEGYARGMSCNAQTGQCECLPNVIGERCDACPARHVLIKDEGCFACDNCHGALLDVTDALALNLDPVIAEFESVAFAYFTNQKLNYFEQLAYAIEPEVSSLDPKRVDLEPSLLAFAAIESDNKQLQKELNNLKNFAVDNSKKADLLLLNVTKLSNDTNYATHEARAAISTVDSLSNNLAAVASSRLDAAQQEAQDILKSLQGTSIDLSQREQLLEKAVELLKDVETNMQPIKQQNATFELLKASIGELSDKLEDLFGWSVSAINRSYEVELLNKQNQMSLENAQLEVVGEREEQAEKNLEKAHNNLINGDITLDTIDKNLGKLNTALTNLQNINSHIDEELPNIESQQAEAVILTKDAEQAAEKLRAQAAHLSEQYAHITANAEPAIKAATAYSNIAEAVDSASQLARQANEAAKNATEITEGVEERASLADKNSAELLEKARLALDKVKLELEPLLNSSKQKVDSIYELNAKTEKTLKELNIGLEQSPANSLRDIWQNYNENAVDALGIMEDLRDSITPIVKQTPIELEKALNLSKEIDTTNKHMSNVDSIIGSTNAALSKMEQLANEIDEEQQKIETNRQTLAEQVEALKSRIDAARQIANDIKVGVHFTPATVLELKAPETLPLLSGKSKISTYFNTQKPDGLITFLGNDQNKTKAKDFISLELVNGYPVLRYDLGKGQHILTNEKQVTPGQWYQAIIERTPHDISLTIREELDNGTVEEHVNEKQLEPAQEVFNVDRNTRLFVGAAPEDFMLPEEINSPAFEGDIEDLRVGEEKVGLYNFVYGEGNTKGALPRNKLISDERPPTGYRFNGMGYITMKATPYNFRTRSSIQFRFKADKDAKDGLLFLYGRHNEFMSIELVNGGVYFRLKLGANHLISSGTHEKEQYNDNQWHRVVAERDGRRGLLKVDDVLVFQKEADKEANETMHNFKMMYFGGAPGIRNNSFIVQQNFEGCIDDVTIAGTKVDLAQHVSAEGVRPGCPAKFANTLSFSPQQHGYLRSANIHANNDFHIELTFRTRQPEGVIFYATNYNQSAAMGLTLENGHLILRNLDKLTNYNKEGLNNELVFDKQRLDDGVDHTVTVQHTEQELRLTVDNNEDLYVLAPYPLIIYAGDIFFGGLPPKYIAPDSSLSTHAYFVGCISDVKYRGEVINFAESPEKQNGNTHTTGCPASLLAYDPTTVDIHYADGSYKSYDELSESRGPPLAPISDDYQEPATTTTTVRTTTTARTTTSMPPVYINMINNTDSISGDLDEDLLTLKSSTTTMKPEPQKCVLPTNPNFDVSFDEAGYRFAVIKDQRLELTPPSRMKKHFDISFVLRTANSTGLLFYAADEHLRHSIIVYLLEGYVHFEVNIDNIRAELTSEVPINDMSWHSLQILRINRKLRLLIDNVNQSGEATLSDPEEKTMIVDFPVYVGGVPKLMENVLKEVVTDEKSIGDPYFNGCIKDIKISGKPIKVAAYNVVPCSDQTEYGLFFQKSNSYVKLVESFNVGVDVSITFDFKPRDPNGLLFSVHSKHGYMILELVENQLVFTVKSDTRNRVQTNYTLPDNGNFCDGQWRNVQAVKSSYVITIFVQYIGAQPSIGPPGTSVTKTSRPLFLGGHQLIHKVPGLQTRKGFKGCIRNLYINKNQVSISNEQIYGEVWRGVCPLN